MYLQLMTGELFYPLDGLFKHPLIPNQFLIAAPDVLAISMRKALVANIFQFGMSHRQCKIQSMRPST